MNKEVSFEVAKLLKEKGYDIKCLTCYLEDGSKQLSSGDEGDFEKYNHNLWDNYSAPTISEVIMWLYEKYGIWIIADPSMSFSSWTPRLFTKHNTVVGKYDGIMEFNSPTEAYEAAIEYFLTNLI